MTDPRVTWLLCTNREDELLHRAIRSCLHQTMTDFELLLVINGENASQLAENLKQAYSYDPRVCVVGTGIRYLNFSLSYGLHLSKASFVARMDADDVAHPDRLTRQLSFMESNRDIVLLGSSYNLIDHEGMIHGRVDLPKTDYEIRKALRFRNPICHPSVMLRRDAVLSVGGYLGGRNAEDYDLWLRLAMDSSMHFANLPEPLLSYNIAPDGVARRSREAYANVASAQLRQFLVTRDGRWLIGAALSSAKSFFVANRL